jgi:1-acyl-sn-glycerol-3-phosphate acyltransferase
VKRCAALLVVLAAFACSSLAWAGRACTDYRPGPEALRKGLLLAERARQALDGAGAEVALIARAGQDLSRYGLRYSHAGFAWRELPGRWRTLVPEFLMRFMVWILIHSVYRLRKAGLERVPEEGAALVVCNHVSFVDALVISAACRRPIRWVMYHRIFRIPFLSFFFRTVRAIPIAPAKEDPEMLERAYESIGRELAAGELVGIFPEGKLTSDGEMDEFRGGLMRILEKRQVPVVPMALSGLWQSLFARNRDKLRHLGKLFPVVRLSVGEPVSPAAVTPEGLHAAVLALRGDWR